MTFTINDAKCIKETERALLITDSAGFEQWVPKSVIHDDSEVYKEDQCGDFVISEWFAEKLGIL